MALVSIGNPTSFVTPLAPREVRLWLNWPCSVGLLQSEIIRPLLLTWQDGPRKLNQISALVSLLGPQMIFSFADLLLQALSLSTGNSITCPTLPGPPARWRRSASSATSGVFLFRECRGCSRARRFRGDRRGLFRCARRV